ncbi:carboxypeptidase regulatory-like domain-containing protein [Lutibacter holmesii]|uniref:Carboxypeptidase regulatory-like domain-containing protein n=1 Tax=Lutibacter holmesii TaxID=1137985 RepID=A0ABW3WQ89_9FLAO
MKKVFNIVFLVAFGLFVGCQEDTIDVVGIGTITGRVVEANSFEPIENAKVSLSPTNNTVFSDVDGYFILEEIEEGDYSVGVTKENYLTTYESATVTTDIEVNVIFEMEDDDALNKAPSTPILKTPEDGSEDHELSVELTWSSTDPDGDEILYTLQVKNDYDNEVLEVLEIADTSYVVSDLKYGVKYFWQITANDGINEDVLSTVYSFKTKVNPENRYLYVKKYDNNNNVIYSANFNESDAVSENEVQLTLEDVNSWRPRKNQTSNRIAFLQTANNATHLFTMKTDGSDVFQVTSAVPVNGNNMNEMDFSWSSNGDKLIYSNYDKLYSINKDGSGLQLIYQTLDGSFISECDWSNDGSMIALKTNNSNGYNVSIYTIDMSGTVLTTILSGVSGAAGGLNISVDNKLLVYTQDVSGYENSNNRQLDTNIYIYDFSASTSTNISINKVLGTNDLDPRFSPNEAEVIFVNTSNDGISAKTIYRASIIADSDNNIERDELFTDAFMPDWE